jgi:hypothetical protein
MHAAAPQVQLRRFITIIESMTEKEQDTTNVKMLTEPSRVMRLAKGSGRSPGEIFQLIEVGGGEVVSTRAEWSAATGGWLGGSINQVLISADRSEWVRNSIHRGRSSSG